MAWPGKDKNPSFASLPPAVSQKAEKYRPIPLRRRLLIGLLGVATASTIAWMLLDPPGGVKRVRHWPGPCAAGQSGDCVGGKVEVIALPPAAASSRP